MANHTLLIVGGTLQQGGGRAYYFGVVGEISGVFCGGKDCIVEGGTRVLYGNGEDRDRFGSEMERGKKCNETDGVVQKVCEAVKAGRCPFFFGSVQYVVFGKSGRDGEAIG